MAYYIEAIREAVAHSDPSYLKPALDFLMDLATEEYKAGALDVLELGAVLDEYESALLETNATQYV